MQKTDFFTFLFKGALKIIKKIFTDNFLHQKKILNTKNILWKKLFNF